MARTSKKLYQSLFDFKAEREIYLVFKDDAEYFGSRLIKPGFKHVFVIERQALGWICFDPNRSDMISTILPASYDVEVIPSFIQNNPDATILKLLVNPHNRSQYPRLGVISCVAAVQYYIGVWWPHILTPYQLYRKLSRINDDSIRVELICQVTAEQNAQQSVLLRKQKEPRNYYRNELGNKKPEKQKTQSVPSVS